MTLINCRFIKFTKCQYDCRNFFELFGITFMIITLPPKISKHWIVFEFNIKLNIFYNIIS